MIRYAREHNLGKVIIGQRPYQKWQWLKRWVRMRFAERLARYAPDLHVISVALNEEEPRYKTKHLCHKMINGVKILKAI